MTILVKEFFSAIAIVLTFVAFIPYIRSILQGKTSPHTFSWIICAPVTSLVFPPATALACILFIQMVSIKKCRMNVLDIPFVNKMGITKTKNTIK